MYCVQTTAWVQTAAGLWVAGSGREPRGAAAPDAAPVPTLWISAPGAPGAASAMSSSRVQPLTAAFAQYKTTLVRKGRAEATIEKYLHNIKVFLAWLGRRNPTPEFIRQWISERETSGAAVSSINGTLSALNGFWRFLGRHDCVVPLLKIERSQYISEEKILTEKDYRKLLAAAGDNPRALTLLQTIASTGIRVSELRFFTVEGVRDGFVKVTNKGRTREIILHRNTRKMLLAYCGKERVRSGVIFKNKKGAALSRGCIWWILKSIGKKAGVAAGKVFPHNLRRFFAVRVYRQTRDIDFTRVSLGHRSADTTTLYIRGSLGEHRRRLDRLKLVERET